jgi:HD-GYP domain-containing protein (c-di-GMP phosphodiesterase class II)
VLRTGNGSLNFMEQLRVHLALCNVFALVPDQLSEPVEDLDEATLHKARELVTRYGEWLQDRRFVGDETLELVLMRYERYDGSGFPRGLSGDEIHEVGHAWALAWSYCDRLVSKPSRPRKTAQGAADELARQAGRAFSPTGINRFLRTVGLFPAGSLVQLSDARLAIVVRQNERALFRPVVRITDGETVDEELDLTEYPGVFIQQQVLEY